MAVVLKCDKCGKIFEYKVKEANCIYIVSKSMFTNKTIGEKQYDICPECAEELKQMFAGKKGE